MRRSTEVRRAAVVVALIALVLAGALPVVAPAAADPGDRHVPSAVDVRRARERAEGTRARVAEIQAQMAMANQRLEAAAVAAAQAYEAYNGARWRLDRAVVALREARADARRAARQMQRQRDRLAGIVTAGYQEAGGVSALDALTTEQGPEGVMTQLLALEGASTSVDARLQQFGAVATLAEVFEKKAVAAQEQQRKALAAAASSKAAAEAAASAAASSARSVAAEKSRLVADLARLQGISTALAERRQSALEESARRRAARAAARAAEPTSAPIHGSGPTVTHQDPPPPRDPSPPARPSARPSAPPPSAPPAPPPPPAPPASGGAASRGGAAAVAFARAQLGEPYVWGAAGPSSWDCSGLTMRAWEAAGVSLPHYSVAQYAATTAINAVQLRPGDLVFWGSTSSPSSIYHVALYAGDGMIIHAPRTGRPVSLESMYYWIPPTFFGRP